VVLGQDLFVIRLGLWIDLVLRCEFVEQLCEVLVELHVERRGVCLCLFRRVFALFEEEPGSEAHCDGFIQFFALLRSLWFVLTIKENDLLGELDITREVAALVADDDRAEGEAVVEFFKLSLRVKEDRVAIGEVIELSLGSLLG